MASAQESPGSPEHFLQSLESARNTLKEMDDAQLMSMWSLTKNGKALMTVPRIGFIRSIMMNHVYHHRGQLSSICGCWMFRCRQFTAQCGRKSVYLIPLISSPQIKP